MKKTLLALALLASASTAFATDGPKPTAKAGKRADGCTGMAAAKCDKSMMTASAKMDGMPACCRAKMAARAAATTTASAAKPVVKSL
ncbi:hypothetical protein HHL22_03775 [Hymenobacter sp. RP-2-7]|uniref:Phosphate starvation-inducible protein PsiF n=1 Tax=Hymenobacter polaris TaxID=2682546 RepID=A0A7Y0FL02_9BACT|nr:hypothetical protein [Hymenobacter polaris]NML64317.1 hypothetical protein [Hymenobacter polaris]